MNSIQNNIKRHLHAKNMTAAELERRTGIPHAVVNILHGRSKNPSLKTAQAIAKELGCSIEDLFAEEAAGTAPDPDPATNSQWQAKIYAATCETVLQTIEKLHLQPSALQVAKWLTEVYEYTLGSPTQTVDPRFVAWLLNKR